MPKKKVTVLFENERALRNILEVAGPPNMAAAKIGDDLVFVCPICKQTIHHGAAAYGHRIAHCQCWPGGYYLVPTRREVIDELVLSEDISDEEYEEVLYVLYKHGGPIPSDPTEAAHAAIRMFRERTHDNQV